MKPPRFVYRRAHSKQDALDILADGDVGTRILAGGQSLIPMMNLRMARPTTLIDISPIEKLNSYHTTQSHLFLGAQVKHQFLVEASSALPLPILGMAAAHIGHRAIRNRGTVGGSLCNGDPRAELIAVARLLDADIMLESTKGLRSVAAREFFLGAYDVDLRPEEMLTWVRFPLRENVTYGFHEFARRPGDFAMAGAAVIATRNQCSKRLEVDAWIFGSTHSQRLLSAELEYHHLEDPAHVSQAFARNLGVDGDDLSIAAIRRAVECARVGSK